MDEELAIDVLHEIEHFVRETKTELLEAILHYCEVKNIDVETMATIILRNENTLGKLTNEAMKKSLLKERVATLDVLFQ